MKGLNVIPFISFGTVESTLSVNESKNRLETVIRYELEDLKNLIASAAMYYDFPPKQSQRKQEIADTLFRLKKLLDKEKSVVGYISSPIIEIKPDKQATSDS